MVQDQVVGCARGPTPEYARRVGDALVAAGFIDGDDSATVLLDGPAGGREISLKTELDWGDELLLLELDSLVEDIAPAMDGKPATVRLVDQEGNERKRFHVN